MADRMLDRFDILQAFGAVLVAVLAKISLGYVAVFLLLNLASRYCCCWSWPDALAIFAAVVVTDKAEISLIYLALFLVLFLGVRCSCCCFSKQPTRTSKRDTQEKFLQPETEKEVVVPAKIETQMLFSLDEPVAPVSSVGGKAASLMKLYSNGLVCSTTSSAVPDGFALSVAFFQPWIDKITESEEWKAAEPKLMSEEAPSICAKLKEFAKSLPLSDAQLVVVKKLGKAINSWESALAAVRSSTPEEDGEKNSYAGVFETVLGVTSETVEAAIRECFASAFDYRVFSYAGAHTPSFAAVVMEMVDSHKAGVAFTANPLNSDRDEIMIDSSWGLGESVVDGSVVAGLL